MPIYFGNNKVAPSGVKAAYYGTNLVYKPIITKQMFIKTTGFKRAPYTENTNPLILINDFDHYYQDVPNLTEINDVYGVAYHDKPIANANLTIKYNDTTVMSWDNISSIPNIIDLTQWIDFSSNLNWYFARTVIGNVLTGISITLNIYNTEV